MKANFSLRWHRIIYMRTLKYYELNLQEKLLLEKKKNQHVDKWNPDCSSELITRLFRKQHTVYFFFFSWFLVRYLSMFSIWGMLLNNILLVFHFCNCYLLIGYRKRKKWQHCMIFHIHICNYFSNPDIFLKMGREKREKFLTG